MAGRHSSLSWVHSHIFFCSDVVFFSAAAGCRFFCAFCNSNQVGRTRTPAAEKRHRTPDPIKRLSFSLSRRDSYRLSLTKWPLACSTKKNKKKWNTITRAISTGFGGSQCLRHPPLPSSWGRNSSYWKVFHMYLIEKKIDRVFHSFR